MTETQTVINDDAIVEMLLDDRRVEQGVRLLMKKYGEKLYWFIRRMVVEHCDAEDTLQETMINVYKYRTTYNKDFALSTWLLKIAQNECIKTLRKKAAAYSTSVDDLGDSLKESVRAESDADMDQAVILMQQAIAMLPAKQKTVFNLRYYEEKSYEEIHEILGDSVNTLKTNYHYAVNKIKQYITDHSL
ncbi:MAG: sigma-70 family RNA polymerase sigma factor [Bacteroidaceae bacterium]|nr:sigma-70 family RNA polymerase sigma factor [Bacteroidaceae bacterium]